jgi:6-phosphogluconolactonase
MTNNREVRILANANSIAQTAAAEFLEAAQQAVSEKGSFSVALAGGSTPKALYGLLATNPLLQAKVPWSKIQFFFGDERHVPPTDEESNFRMAEEAMLGKAPVDPKQVHRIKGEKRNAAQAAEEYEQDLRTSFRLQPGQFPRFDLVLLGMGPEGAYRFSFSRHKSVEGRTPPGRQQLGGQVLHGSHHLHAARLEQRRPRNLHGPW